MPSSGTTPRPETSMSGFSCRMTRRLSTAPRWWATTCISATTWGGWRASVSERLLGHTRRGEAVRFPPFLGLLVRPAGRPGHVGPVQKHLGLGIAVAIAEHIDIRDSGVGAGWLRQFRGLTPRLMGVQVGVAV